MSPVPGSVFAGFTIVRKLGAGGMGEVYLVEHPRLPRREALKILPSTLTSDNEYRQRFIREAELAATIWHPHVVAVHDRGEFEGQLWITMDYVEGTDASVLLRSRYPAGLPPELVTEIVSGVADALDHAHERGLLHRDVKPANILLTDSAPESTKRRRILLSDFGIARKMDDANGLTATNMTVGSIAYAAPEQLMGRTLDGQADQYALATTAFHLLTGRPPFDNSNAAVVISSHLTSPPPAMGERRPDLAGLDAVISKGMSKRPEDRYPSCSDFAQALAAAVEAQPRTDHATLIAPAAGRVLPPSNTPPSNTPQQTSAAPVAGPPPSARPAPVAQASSPPKRRRTGLIVGIAAAVVIALGLTVGILLMRGSSDSKSGDSVASGTSAPVAPTAAGDPSLVAPAKVTSLLIDAQELSSMSGHSLTSDASSATVLDASRDFPTRPECASAIYPLEKHAYGSAGQTGAQQNISQSPESAAYFLVDQSVATFPSAAAATKVLDASKQQWQACAGGPVEFANQGGTNTVATLADVTSSGNTITQDRTVAGGGYTCQHTLGVWSNVVAEAVACGEGDITGKSEAVVAAILANAQA